MLISVTFSKWPKIVAKHLGYFCKELCSKELSKIANLVTLAPIKSEVK